MKRTKKKENKSMEGFKIGDEIKIVLKVEEDNGGCDNCFFVEDGLCRKPINRFVDGFDCLKEERSDNKNVIFKLMSCNTDNTKATLWHEASEEPDEGEQILYIAQECDEIVDTKVTTTALYDIIPWCAVVDKYQITKWLYIKDILPKGGEK